MSGCEVGNLCLPWLLNLDLRGSMLWTGRAALVQAGYELQQLMGVAKLVCLLANPPNPSPLHALTAMMEPARQSGF